MARGSSRQPLLEEAGQRREHQGAVESQLVHLLQAWAGLEERRDRAHRLAEQLALGLAVGVAVLEVLLPGARLGDDLEGRVGDVVADLTPDRDLRPPVDLRRTGRSPCTPWAGTWSAPPAARRDGYPRQRSETERLPDATTAPWNPPSQFARIIFSPRRYRNAPPPPARGSGRAKPWLFGESARASRPAKVRVFRKAVVTLFSALENANIARETGGRRCA